MKIKDLEVRKEQNGALQERDSTTSVFLCQNTHFFIIHCEADWISF